MKKYLQSSTWKYLSAKHTAEFYRRRHKEKIHIGRRKRENKKEKDDNENAIHYAGVSLFKKAVEIRAPENFNLLENIDETIAFFCAVDNFINAGKRIYFDLSEVKNISSDGILYLLSRLEHNRQKRISVSIKGNYPKDQMCREILEKSGFPDYVYSGKSLSVHSDPDVYSTKSGRYVMPEKSAEVKRFAMKCLGKEESNETKDIYKIIIECMTNTRQHAYISNGRYSKWWLMALFNKVAGRVHFTFCDNGYGIPYTVRKNHTEQLRAIFSGIPIIKLQDNSLIKAALEGNFRSRTGLTYRGKGLPKMKEIAENGSIENLIVMSRKGCVDSSFKNVKELPGIFHGTLLSWDFV